MDRLSRDRGPLSSKEWTALLPPSPRDLGRLYEPFAAWDLVREGEKNVTGGVTLAWKENDRGRKASGSYYTPEHITTHMVRSALHPLLEDVTRPTRDRLVNDRACPNAPVRFRWPRILDPAMGCGYFLLEAADQLCAWAREDGSWHGATEGDLSFLRNSIVANALYGVDKDPVAVDLTVQALTGWAEGRMITPPSRSYSTNLFIGNALTGPLPGQTAHPSMPMDRVSIHCDDVPLDWAARFPAAFQDTGNPGFHAVVGNPPYDNSRGGLEDHPELAAVARHVRASGDYRIKGAVDLYRLFLQRSLQLCRAGGVLSMIVPRTLLGDRDAAVDREILASETEILSIDDFPSDDSARRVFPSASQSACIVTCRKGATGAIFPVRRWTHGDMTGGHDRREVRLTELERFWPGYLPYVALGEREWEILKKLFASPRLCPLSEIAEAGIGEANSGYHKAFMVGEETGSLLIRGTDVSPYHVQTNGASPKRWIDREGFLNALSDGARANLKAGHTRVVKQAVRNMALPKRLVAGLAEPGQFLADSTDFFLPNPPYDPRYVLALLNSRTVMEWLFRLVSTNNNVNLYQVRHLPVPRIRFTSPGGCSDTGGLPGAPQADHDLLVRLAGDMTDARRMQREGTLILEERAALDARIEAMEREIDSTIWGMYGLSEEEVRLVNASLNRG